MNCFCGRGFGGFGYGFFFMLSPATSSLIITWQVLQEVAAARQVLIMDHHGEIDGYVFCCGLERLHESGTTAKREREVDTEGSDDSSLHEVQARHTPEGLNLDAESRSLTVIPLIKGAGV